MSQFYISFDDFVKGATGPSSDGDCRVEAYLPEVSKCWDYKNLEPVPGHPHFWFNTDDFNVYLVAETGPDGEYELAGYYFGGAVGVLETYRGHNLGIELVLKAAELREGSPFNGIESHAFSASGWRMHVKAYQEGLNRGLFLEPMASSFSI